ncbi:hypothetical protein L204_104174 [Cryptococcus depauperatus]
MKRASASFLYHNNEILIFKNKLKTSDFESAGQQAFTYLAGTSTTKGDMPSDLKTFLVNKDSIFLFNRCAYSRLTSDRQIHI